MAKPVSAAESALTSWIADHLLPLAGQCTAVDASVAYCETLAQANMLFIFLELLAENCEEPG
jgi:hypothetical protein